MRTALEPGQIERSCLLSCCIGALTQVHFEIEICMILLAYPHAMRHVAAIGISRQVWLMACIHMLIRTQIAALQIRFDQVLKPAKVQAYGVDNYTKYTILVLSFSALDFTTTCCRI